MIPKMLQLAMLELVHQRLVAGLGGTDRVVGVLRGLKVFRLGADPRGE